MRTLRFEHLLTPEGFRRAAIEVDDKGRIVAVEPIADDSAVDGWIALPGMVNAHSHAFQRAMAGLAERGGAERSFWGWREVMYRIAQRMTPEQQYAVARGAFAEMLAAGYTTVGEFHYLHHGVDGAPGTDMARAVIDAAADAGIRLALLPVCYLHGGFGAAALPEQARFVHESVDAFIAYAAELGPAVRGIAPHSLRAVDIDTLPVLVGEARRRLGDDIVVHIHVAEQRREVEDCVAATGKRPVQLLCEHAAPDRRWALVHATHADASERAAMLGAGVTAVLCPLTEAHLGDGLFAAAEFAFAGGHIAIGSDCNARIDAIEELRLLEYGQRLAHERRPVLGTEEGTGAVLWAAAARAGARALGLDAGEIAPGRFADLVVLAREAPLDGLEANRALDAWLVGGSRDNVASCYVGGERRDPALVSIAPIVAQLAAGI